MLIGFKGELFSIQFFYYSPLFLNNHPISIFASILDPEVWKLLQKVIGYPTAVT